MLASRGELRREDVNSQSSGAITDLSSEAFYRESGWNLQNIPLSRGSILQHISEPISGVNVPWLYCGMLMTSFCWHNEDNYLYSINYSHLGAAKQWYSIPNRAVKLFEKTIKESHLQTFRDIPNILYDLNTQFSPSYLLARDVPVYRMIQEERTFIITFPKAYHAGFNYGFNCNEAVNFGTSDWLEIGREASERYRLSARPSVFSHDRLLFTAARHIKQIHNIHDRYVLIKELLALVEEDLYYRQAISTKDHVQDLSEIVKLARNNYAVIDKKAMDYDEMRVCCICKHICLLSAVACWCNSKRVTCMRHLRGLCKCSNSKKYILGWTSLKELIELKTKLVGAIDTYHRFINVKIEGTLRTEAEVQDDFSRNCHIQKFNELVEAFGEYLEESAELTSKKEITTVENKSERPDSENNDHDSTNAEVLYYDKLRHGISEHNSITEAEENKSLL